MRRVAAAVVGALVVTLAGCGANYPDLMAVRRSGELPDAELELVINDGGTVSCDGGEPVQLAPRLLLDARGLAEELADDAARGLSLPRRPGAQLRFAVETKDGTLAFSDVDGARDPALGRLMLLVRAIARDVCGRVR